MMKFIVYYVICTKKITKIYILFFFKESYVKLSFMFRLLNIFNEFPIDFIKNQLDFGTKQIYFKESCVVLSFVFRLLNLFNEFPLDFIKNWLYFVTKLILSYCF